jgi:hypothetical protein
LAGQHTHLREGQPLGHFCWQIRQANDQQSDERAVFDKPARIRGGALANYLSIGLGPQVLVPCLVAWRFSGIGAGWIGGLLFVGTPLVIMLWIWAVYRRNPVPAFTDQSGAG